jgi:hypothetical protein
MPPVTERPKSWNQIADTASEVPTRWKQAGATALLANDLDRLLEDDNPTQALRPDTRAWGEVAGWALRLLAAEPAELPSRDAADSLDWLGSGDDLEWFEAPDLEPLEGSLKPHEHGRHLADVYGLQEQIDQARARLGVQKRRMRQNRTNARQLARS